MDLRLTRASGQAKAWTSGLPRENQSHFRHQGVQLIPQLPTSSSQAFASKVKSLVLILARLELGAIIKASMFFFFPQGSSSPPSRRRCQHDTPRTVGFSLVRASSVSLRGDHSGKISFEHVLVDLNCLWRPRASVFRCKESGLYYFSFNARGRADKQAENGQTAWL